MDPDTSCLVRRFSGAQDARHDHQRVGQAGDEPEGGERGEEDRGAEGKGLRKAGPSL
jgi:hypothetical protein